MSKSVKCIGGTGLGLGLDENTDGEHCKYGGQLKWVISKQASILELPQGSIGAMTNT
jgi:hypothetical protein